jgi:hypothetical protein
MWRSFSWAQNNTRFLGSSPSPAAFSPRINPVLSDNKLLYNLPPNLSTQIPDRDCQKSVRHVTAPRTYGEPDARTSPETLAISYPHTRAHGACLGCSMMSPGSQGSRMFWKKPVPIVARSVTLLAPAAPGRFEFPRPMPAEVGALINPGLFAEAPSGLTQ